MKSLILSAALGFGLIATGASAQSLVLAQEKVQYEYGASAFLGLTFTFGPNGGQPGATLKFLSSNEPNKVAAAAGVTYNFDGTFGCDVGLGYVNNDVAGTVGYDFCLGGVQVGLGGLTNKPTLVIEEEENLG